MVKNILLFGNLLHKSIQFCCCQLATEVLHFSVGDVATIVLVQGLESQLCPCRHLRLARNGFKVKENISLSDLRDDPILILVKGLHEKV